MSRGFVKEGDQEEVPMILPRAFLPSGVTNYVTKNYLDAKMRLLSERISSAVVVDTTKANPDVVSFGMYVRYNDKTIRIVGVDEADASKGLISFISPIAKALIGKKKGDKFEIKVPRGTESIEIQEVATFLSTELRAMSHEQNTVTETVEVASFVHEITRKKHENIGSSFVHEKTRIEHENIGSSFVHEKTRKEHENIETSYRGVTPVAYEKKVQQPIAKSQSSNPKTLQQISCRLSTSKATSSVVRFIARYIMETKSCILQCISSFSIQRMKQLENTAGM